MGQTVVFGVKLDELEDDRTFWVFSSSIMLKADAEEVPLLPGPDPLFLMSMAVLGAGGRE